jgi:hypothetical protein
MRKGWLSIGDVREGGVEDFDSLSLFFFFSRSRVSVKVIFQLFGNLEFSFLCHSFFRVVVLVI